VSAKGETNNNATCFLDAPAAFVDFVLEAMLPELADYGISV
jgi:hypothetical protein